MGGSNIGTTTTSLLAALASSGENANQAVQIALVHLFFNIFGILIFYPIPFMRWPIGMASSLGKLTSNYRWFSLCYLLLAFFLLPLIIFALSLIGPLALYLTLIPAALIIIFVTIINFLQKRAHKKLPQVLQTWEFLPEPLRSLEPLDRMITKMMKIFTRRRSVAKESLDKNENINKGFEKEGNESEMEMY